MSKERLREELDEVVENRHADYEYEIAEHASGPAIDIQKYGEAPEKVVGSFCEAAMECGYVVTATLVHDGENYDHTRMFLHEAEEYFDLAEEPDTEHPWAGQFNFD